jgi:hypothetical protein
LAGSFVLGVFRLKVFQYTRSAITREKPR